MENVLAIETCMLVAFPRVHGEATRLKLAVRYSLAEGKIRVAGMGSEFNESGGLVLLDQPRREGDVLDPCIWP